MVLYLIIKSHNVYFVVDEVHSTDHDEETMHDTSDHRTIFGLKNKHKLRIPSKRGKTPLHVIILFFCI